MILEEKLTKEVERLKLLPETQAGFRKRRSCIDNIFALKITAEKTITKKKGKLYVFFANLKAAFDKVNRKKLWKVLEERGINRKLINRIKDIYEETINMVIIGDKCTEEFWTEGALRQGCLLSSLLFITFIADVEDFLKKRQNGGARLGKRRIYTLAYVDDLAMMAETKKEMKKMLKSLERYLEEEELTLNADKSKMFFCKKKRIKQERNWKWKNSKIEEVKEFKYLGFTFKKSNTDEAHVKDIIRKAAAAIAQVWGIDERKFGGNFDRRMMMFNVMVKSILLYGVEIWGWTE